MKRTMTATAVAALALTSFNAGAFTSAPIQMDITGGGGPTTTVSYLNWLGGNALAIGVLGPNGSGATGVSNNIVAQASLNSFVDETGGTTVPTTPVAGQEFTYQLDFWEFSTGIGSGTAAFTLDTTKAATFTMYYDATADADSNTGLGYGAGTGAVAILQGTIVGMPTSNFTSFTDQGVGNPLYQPETQLDGTSPDNTPGVITDAGVGNTTLEVDVTSFDSNFFLSSIDTLMIDVVQTLGVTTPFNTTNPSSSVVGNTPDYGDQIGVTTAGYAYSQWNGLDSCGTDADGICDFQFETGGRTSFEPVAIPVPAPLALLGGGLALLGFAQRKKLA